MFFLSHNDTRRDANTNLLSPSRSCCLFHSLFLSFLSLSLLLFPSLSNKCIGTPVHIKSSRFCSVLVFVIRTRSSHFYLKNVFQVFFGQDFSGFKIQNLFCDFSLRRRRSSHSSSLQQCSSTTEVTNVIFFALCNILLRNK